MSIVFPEEYYRHRAFINLKGEVTMKIKIFVLGSCYSGYMFKEKLLGNLACGNIEMVYQHQHDSLISVMTKPVEADLSNAKSKYQWDFDHFAESIFKKDVLDKIIQMQPDYLLFDTYAEATSPIVKVDEETYITANYYIKDSSVFESMKDKEILWPSNPKRRELFEQYAPMFFSYIRENVPGIKIILVRAKAACELYDPAKGVLENFYYTDKVEEANERRYDYDELVMTYNESVRILNMLDEYGVADVPIYEDYRYEISHNHYPVEYYRRQYSKLQSLLLTDLCGGRETTRYFRQAICMVAGEDYELVLFLSRIYKDFFRVYIQIDASYIGSSYTIKQIERLRAIPNVFVITKYKSPKGSYQELQLMLQMAQMAFSCEDVYSVHFVSGNDCPMRPINQIYQFFEEHQEVSFLNLHADGKQEEMQKVAEYTCRQYYYLYDGDEKDPSVKRMSDDSIRMQKEAGICREGIGEFKELYKGVLGGTLSREAYTYCMEYVKKHPDYLKDIKYSRLRAEFFFHTILMNTPALKEKISAGVRGGRHGWIWDDKAKDYARPDVAQYRKIRANADMLFVRYITSDNTEVMQEIYKDIKTPYRVD